MVTFRNIPRKLMKTQACRTFLEHSGTFLGRTESDAHIPYCIFVPYRSGPIRSRPLFYLFFFFPLSILLFSFVFFLRNRPYQADSTTSRPICEVKLPRARVVLRWGTTWEVRVLILLRLFNARSLVFHFIIII